MPTFQFFMSLAAFLCSAFLIKDLKKELKTLRKSRDRWEEYYTQRIEQLEYQLTTNSKQYAKKHVSPNDPEIIHAVRYAMKHAHPDDQGGGNREKFERFKALLDQIS